jgi:hypothetical protein
MDFIYVVRRSSNKEHWHDINLLFVTDCLLPALLVVTMLPSAAPFLLA